MALFRHFTIALMGCLLASSLFADEPVLRTTFANWSSTQSLAISDNAFDANRFDLAQLTFVDRSDPLTVLREERTLALVKLWSSKRAQLFFGVGPTGFAGLNFTSRRSFLKRRPRTEVFDYSDQVRELTRAFPQSSALSASSRAAP